jgi:Protein of unknown function (DUF2961)
MAGASRTREGDDTQDEGTSMNPGPRGLLSELTRVRDARSARASSWDQTGRNRDYWVIGPGESAILADIEGPGCITHIWMTQSCRRIPGPGLLPAELAGVPMLYLPTPLGADWEVVDPDYYRKIVLKMFWDDQTQPSVLVPLGDFFGLMNSLAGNYSAMPLSVSVIDSDRLTFGGSASLNAYFQMPFGTRARIELENQNDVAYLQYFAIDYELYRHPLTEDIAYFHAQWRRQLPGRGWGPDLHVNSQEVESVPNLDGADNYTILDVEGRGHYVGCQLAVRHLQGSWWGEGDDMIFVDDDTWPPSLHGTGGEDYFGHAWGMQHNAFPMSGSSVHEKDVPGFQHSYRFHLTDPVRFSKRIRVTMEHGHANHLSDDWSSTAYWYQTLPTGPFRIPPVSQRLPLRPRDLPNPEPIEPRTGAAHDARVAAWERRKALSEDRTRELAARAAETAASAEANRAQAAEVRRRFLGS